MKGELARLSHLQSHIGLLKSDAVLISSPTNVFYLSGFGDPEAQEREGYLLVDKSNIILVTDSRYTLTASVLGKKLNCKVHIFASGERLSAVIKNYAVEHKWKHIAIEADDLKVSELTSLKKTLRGTALYKKAEGVVATMRVVKSTAEVRSIKRACKTALICFEEFVKTINIGQTEKELVFVLESIIRKKGFEPSFDTIVAIDKNSAEPHYSPKQNGKARVKVNSVILVDWGVRQDGYCSDYTRMIFMGTPTKKIKDIYTTLEKAYEAGAKILKPGVKYKEVDAVCRKILDEAKLPKYGHATGHGVGLAIHEGPVISILSQLKAEKGHVVTLEPGVYIPGKFGMRYENTIVI